MNIKKRAAAFAIAFLMAVSPLQQSFFVSADELPEETEKTVENVLPEELKAEEEPDSTEAETDQEDTEITEEMETTETIDTAESEADDTVAREPLESEAEEQKNNIVTAGSSEEYFKLIADFPDFEKVIVDTYEDLSDLEVSYGIYFDGTYILGFERYEDLVKAVGKLFDMNVEYSLDGTVSVCGDTGETLKVGTVNPDADIKVAVIDTGSNLANESYSVIGDDAADYNGHGTAMCGLILNETDNAYIISIKAIGDDGKGNMSDVYTAVQLAEDIGVDYILMAMSIRNAGHGMKRRLFGVFGSWIRSSCPSRV